MQATSRGEVSYSLFCFPSSVEVPLAEGPVNLNWSQIMKTVNDSPYEFFKEGGWGFLVGADNGSEAVRERSTFVLFV
jgi:nucleosome binding factor SPN SPT16 subunit